MKPAVGFREWRDRLLLALADEDAETGGTEFDLGVIAEKRAPGFQPGWVEKAATLFHQRRWIELSPTLSLGPDRGFFSTLTGEGLEAADELRAQLSEPVEVSDGAKATNFVEAPVIPAADRFVTLAHNSAEYSEAIERVESLARAVQQTNSPLFVDESHKLAVIREVRGIRELLNGASVRVAAVVQYIRNGGVLPWLLATAGAGVVGNYAYAVIEALRRLFRL